jgi:hypothetical protein
MLQGLSQRFKLDGFARSPKTLFSVIPAEAGVTTREAFLETHQVRPG